MKEFWSIIELFVQGSILGGIIVFLGKFILNKSSELLIENHKSKLEILKTEHQIKFSQLHSERGQILKKLYQNLYNLEQKLLHLTSFFQGPDWKYDDDREHNANKVLTETISYIELNRIYLPESLCIRLLENLNKFEEIIHKMGEARTKAKVENLLQNSRIIEGEKSKDIWKYANLSVKNEIKKLRLELADEFRNIIEV